MMNSLVIKIMQRASGAVYYQEFGNADTESNCHIDYGIFMGICGPRTGKFGYPMGRPVRWNHAYLLLEGNHRKINRAEYEKLSEI